MAHLSIHLLGPPEVLLNDRLVTAFATDKARALFYYLAAENAHPHRRETLAGLLWADQPEERARQNLRQALTYLRQALGEGEEAAVPFLRISRETVQLDPAGDYELDIVAFVELIQACQRHRHRRLSACRPCLERLHQAVELYRGDFLAGFFLGDSTTFEEWAMLKREWLHREAVAALAALADCHERRGEYESARAYAYRQVQLEPWREEAHCQLMRLWALAGQRSAALAQYEACVRALADELAVEPTAETQKLYARIQGGMSVSPALLPHNLPPAATSFIGREAEMAELAGLLADPDCRLVTLVGPGGGGKTRLALQVAAEALGGFADGVYLVPLGGVPSPEAVVPVIADTLGFALYGREAPREQLLGYLRQKEMLLVLDNMEHLLAATDLLAAILQRAPGIVLLVTSRERLNLQEEWVYEVSGLESGSAVALFADRARRVQRRFSPTDEAPHVARICQLVEGLPLGVELAAAWVGTHPCAEIAAALAHDLDTLTTTFSNVPARHRSMRACFEHSWGLLTAGEQAAFGQLAIFCGGFQGLAAEQVAGTNPALLAALVAKSLLSVDTSGRYRVHELLRQYAAEKLATLPAEERAARGRHSAHYAAFLDARVAGLQGPRQKDTLIEVAGEMDNVRAAWRWAVEQGRRADVAVALVGLDRFYDLRCRYQEGYEAFSLAVTHLGATADQTLLRARLLARQGRFANYLGQAGPAREMLEQGLALARQEGAREEEALALLLLGQGLSDTGNPTAAEQSLHEALRIYREQGDRYSQVQTLAVLQEVMTDLGRFDQAREHILSALELARAIGAQQSMASALSNLGRINGIQGRYDEAREQFQSSLAIYRDIGSLRGMAGCLHNLATVAYVRGDYPEVRRLRLEVLAISRELGFLWGVGSSLRGLGDVACQLGEYDEAGRYLREALSIYQELGERSSQALTLAGLGIVARSVQAYESSWHYFREGLSLAMETGVLPILLDILDEMAGLLLAQGKKEQALEWVALVLAQPACEQQTRDQAERLRTRALAQLSPRTAAAAEARGRARALEAAVAEMLGGGDEKR